MSSEHADSGWDDYSERVVRNEGALHGLERLVSETREADSKLVEQRSASLARELERRAESVETITRHDREADLREYRGALAAHIESARALREVDQANNVESLALLRELYDTALEKNFEQSHVEVRGVREIHDLHINKLTLRLEHEMVLAREKVASDLIHVDERWKAALDQLCQQVQGWRTTDREAREIQASEYARRLDELNHAHERQETFQNSAVTRELWQAEKDSQAVRDTQIREQIIVLEKTQLGFTPQDVTDKANREIVVRCEALVGATRETLEEKLSRIDERVNDLRTQQNVNSGRSMGSSSAVGWVVAAITLLISIIGVVVVVANVLT